MPGQARIILIQDERSDFGMIYKILVISCLPAQVSTISVFVVTPEGLANGVGRLWARRGCV